MRFGSALLLGTLVCGALAADPTTPKVPTEALKTVARINELRALVGQAPVTYDATRGDGCTKHAKYLVLHDAKVWLAKDPLNYHDEVATLAGFTPEGQAAARSSVVAWKEPLPAIDDYVSGIFHRVPILDPRLKSVAIGRATGTKWGAVSLVDVLSGVDASQPWDRATVVTYPADAQRDVPLILGNEMPNPIPQDPDHVGGYPVTATFAPGAKVTGVTATLRRAGKDVPAWVSTPEAPAVAGYQGNTVGLVAHDALLASATYDVAIEATVDGVPWKKAWSFTTKAAPKKRR